MVAQYRQLEVILFEYLHPLFQYNSSIEHTCLVALVVDVILSIFRHLEVRRYELRHIRIGESRCGLEHEQVSHPVQALIVEVRRADPINLLL